ncbi:MAG TPA: hypothetical protein VJT13_12310 [Xanthobacteraceae bacterium]|nr:hypothetical protein [Xanthobacteraceae bacterium]
MTRDGLLLLIGGGIAIAVVVTGVFLRKLKRSVKNWSPTKGVMLLFVGNGQANSWKKRSVDLNPSQRALLKQQIAGPNETVSDAELDLYLELNRGFFTSLMVCEIAFFALLYFLGVIR